MAVLNASVESLEIDCLVSLVPVVGMKVMYDPDDVDEDAKVVTFPRPVYNLRETLNALDRCTCTGFMLSDNTVVHYYCEAQFEGRPRATIGFSRLACNY